MEEERKTFAVDVMLAGSALVVVPMRIRIRKTDQLKWFLHGRGERMDVTFNKNGSPFETERFEDIPAGRAQASGPVRGEAEKKPYRYTITIHYRGQRITVDPEVDVNDGVSQGPPREDFEV